MTWKIDAALALLATPGASVLEALGRKRGGILLLVATLAAGVGIGSASVIWLSDFQTWGPRLTTIERDFEAHVEESATPAMRRLDQLETRFERQQARWEDGEDLGIMRQMVFELYCQEFPGRCQAQPSR